MKKLCLQVFATVLLLATLAKAESNRSFIVVKGKKVPIPFINRAKGVKIFIQEIKSGDDNILGVAWIEGETLRKTRIVVSRLVDGVLLAPRVISDIGPGSQTGLKAASNKETILVWSRFDGKDDEIFFSYSSDTLSDWTHPIPITNNDTPDVLPFVISCKKGFTVLWNSFIDNGYYPMLAKIENGKVISTYRLTEEKNFIKAIEVDKNKVYIYFENRNFPPITLTADKINCKKFLGGK